MHLLLKSLLASSLILLTSLAYSAPTAPRVTLETSKGNIVLELNPSKAPITSENFIEYVKRGFFDGLIFHRVINGFMIQGGGFDEKMIQKSPRSPIRNESGNGLPNSKGTIAMARTQIADSATSQFFINLTDNSFLNGSTRKPGYAVFGRVVQGMDVVEQIAKVRTGRYGPHNDVPVEPIIIKKAVIDASLDQQKNQ